MLSEGIMPAWTSESTVVKSSWIVAVDSVSGEGIAGKYSWSRSCRASTDGSYHARQIFSIYRSSSAPRVLSLCYFHGFSSRTIVASLTFSCTFSLFVLQFSLSAHDSLHSILFRVV